MNKIHMKRNQQHRNYLHEISKKRAQAHSTIPVPRQISNKNKTKPLNYETIFYLHRQPLFCLPSFDYCSRLLFFDCTDNQHWAIGHSTSAGNPGLCVSPLYGFHVNNPAKLTDVVLWTIPVQRLRVHVIVKHFRLLLSHTFSLLLTNGRPQFVAHVWKHGQWS